MAAGVTDSTIRLAALEQSISRIHLSPPMLGRSNSPCTYAPSTASPRPSPQGSSCTATLPTSRLILSCLRSLHIIVTAGLLAVQVVMQWCARFPFGWFASLFFPEYWGYPLIRKPRTKSILQVVPLIFVLICSSPTRPAPFPGDVGSPGQRPLSDNFTVLPVKTGRTAAHTAFSFNLTQLTSEITIKGDEGSALSLSDALATVLCHVGVFAFIRSKLADALVFTSQTFPIFTLLVETAELPKRKGTADWAPGQDARSAPENLTKSTQTVPAASLVKDPVLSLALSVDKRCREDPQASAGALPTETTESDMAVSTSDTKGSIANLLSAVDKNQFNGAVPPKEDLSRQPNVRMPEREAGFDSGRQAPGRRSSTQLPASPPIFPACHMNETPSTHLCDGVIERLRSGAELEQLEAVRQLSRTHLKSWNCIPLANIHAQRLSGGLTNRLYAVEIQGFDEQFCAQGDSHSQTEESGKDDYFSDHRAKRVEEHGASESEAKRMEQTKTRFRGVLSGCSEEMHSGRDMIYPRKVLFRVFGQPAFSNLFDPKTEREVFKLLGQAGLAPRCLAEFPVRKLFRQPGTTAAVTRQVETPKTNRQSFGVCTHKNFHADLAVKSSPTG